MKKMTQKLGAAVVGTTMLLGAMPISTLAATNTIERIVAECSVEGLGQTLHRFELHVNENTSLEGIDAEDFVVENAVADHAGTLIEPKVTEVKVEDNTVTLEVEDFLLFKSGGSEGVAEVSVKNIENEALSFSYSDIDEVVTEIADQFEEGEHNGLVYKLFSPKTEGAQPLVLWMHGRGDNGLQLISSPIATLFASEENQEAHPSYVLAPQSDESVEAARWTDAELEKVIEVINSLIEEGKVDPNRVYVIGHSMGGQGTWNLLRKAPDLFAAAVTIAPRIIEDEAELTDLATLTELPVWLFHATSDPINLVSGSEDRYNKLVELGNDKVKLTTYSDEEMLEYGLGKNSPFETHLSQVLVADNPEVVEWLYSQTKAGEEKQEEAGAVESSEEQLEEVKEKGSNTMPFMIGGVVVILVAAAGFVGLKKKRK